MSTTPPPGSTGPGPDGVDQEPEEHFPGMGLLPEQRRLIKMILIVVAVAIAWAIVAVWVAVS